MLDRNLNFALAIDREYGSFNDCEIREIAIQGTEDGYDCGTAKCASDNLRLTSLRLSNRLQKPAASSSGGISNRRYLGTNRRTRCNRRRGRRGSADLSSAAGAPLSLSSPRSLFGRKTRPLEFRGQRAKCVQLVFRDVARKIRSRPGCLSGRRRRLLRIAGAVALSLPEIAERPGRLHLPLLPLFLLSFSSRRNPAGSSIPCLPPNCFPISCRFPRIATAPEPESAPLPRSHYRRGVASRSSSRVIAVSNSLASKGFTICASAPTLRASSGLNGSSLPTLSNTGMCARLVRVLQPLADLQAAVAWHVNIQHDQIRFEIGDPLEGGRSVVDGGDVVTGIRQNLSPHVLGCHTIVSKQYFPRQKSSFAKKGEITRNYLVHKPKSTFPAAVRQVTTVPSPVGERPTGQRSDCGG
jgi:hypothetical protein